MPKTLSLYVQVSDDDEKGQQVYDALDKVLVLQLQQGNLERWQFEVGE